MSDSLNKEVSQLKPDAITSRQPCEAFIQSKSSNPVSGEMFGKEEITVVVESSLYYWRTSVPFTKKFDTRFAKAVGVRRAFMMITRPSANLLALSSRASSKHEDRALDVDGDA